MFHLTAKEIQPTLLADVWLWFESPGERENEQSGLEHGRIETCTIWITSKPNDYLEFPHVGQREFAYGIASLSAEQADSEQLLRTTASTGESSRCIHAGLDIR